MVYRDNSQFAYTGNSGNTPTSQIIYETRDPTANDIYYQVRTFWINSTSETLWFLNNQSNASGQLLSNWVEVSSGSNVMQSISDTANTPVFPSSTVAVPPNNIQLVGGTGVSIVSNPGSNLLTISNTSQPAFGIIPDNSTPPGTSPVVPNGSGNITVTGAQILNMGLTNVIRTDSLAANTITIEIQQAGFSPTANTTKNGVSHYNSSQFDVDPFTGFVSLIGGTGPAFTSIVTQTFTTNGTYTPTTGMIYCIAEVVGGGGGGGGGGTTGAGNFSGGGGGGGGGYARKTISAATIGVSKAVTVGAGGAGGLAGGSTGTTGGTSSLGSIVTASGGVGGTGSPAGTSWSDEGGDGGIGASGDFNASGGTGYLGFGVFATGINYSGQGGTSIFGAGGKSVYNGGATSSAGNNGIVYGGGGGGAIIGESSTQMAGGNGAAGIVIVTEYI